MSKAVRASNDIEIMENITLVMMETSNSYFDVMRMPYGAFLGTVKQIRMHYFMQNPEWREAYLKWQYQEAYNSENIVKQTKPDIQGLLALQDSG